MKDAAIDLQEERNKLIDLDYEYETEFDSDPGEVKDQEHRECHPTNE